MRNRHYDLMLKAAGDTSIKWEANTNDGMGWMPIEPSWSEDCDYREFNLHRELMDLAEADPTIEWEFCRDDEDTWKTCCRTPSWLPEYQYRQKPKEVPHIHAEMIAQAKSDPTIKWQYYDGYGPWENINNPMWFPEYQYRQNPKPATKTMWLFVKTDRFSGHYLTQQFYASIEEAQATSPNGVTVVQRAEWTKIEVPV